MFHLCDGAIMNLTKENNMNEVVVKCKFCGELYEMFSMMVGDQSCCSECRAKAKGFTYGK